MHTHAAAVPASLNGDRGTTLALTHCRRPRRLCREWAGRHRRADLRRRDHAPLGAQHRVAEVEVPGDLDGEERQECGSDQDGKG